MLAGNTLETHLYYIDGPGGTGKTFLYNAILSALKLRRIPAIAVAWTGIASTLLFRGTTVHRAFKVPLNLNEDSVAGWPIEHPQSQRVKCTPLIIWDEAPMSPKFALHAVDRFLRGLMHNAGAPMGGKVVVIGGDFRQVLPVIPRGNRLLSSRVL